MLAYARDCLDKKTYERILKASRKVSFGIYIFAVIEMLLLFMPLIFLGKISVEMSTAIILFAAFVSPALYFTLYCCSFGKDWNRYVKWYRNTDRLTPFSYENVDGKASGTVKVLSNRLNAFESLKEGTAHDLSAKISDIRGSMYSVTITYDDGHVIKASGELMSGGIFCAYNRSLKKWQPPFDTEEFTVNEVMKIIKDVIDSEGPGKVSIIFDGEFSIADMKGQLTKNACVKYDAGLDGVSNVWIVKESDINIDEKMVTLTYAKGHLPGWEIKDKTVSAKTVSLDEIQGYLIRYRYIYSTKAGQYISEYSRDCETYYEAFLKVLKSPKLF